jgi:hypothetical protein
MSIVFTFYDLVANLEALISGRLNSETLCLYQGNHTPGQGDNTATYLGIECNFGGYSRIPLTFSGAVLNADSVGQTSSQVCVWTTQSHTNLPQSVGGVFSLDASGQVAWADMLPSGSVTLSATGQQVAYMAQVTQGELIS